MRQPRGAARYAKSRSLTSSVGVVDIQERQVITVGMRKLSLGFVCLLALRVGTEVRVWDCEAKKKPPNLDQR